MDVNIEFLRDFLEFDRYRIAELVGSIEVAMRQLGYYLRHHDKGPFTILYRDESDPMYELVQLLDGNSFEVKYGGTFLGAEVAKVTPLYTETIEVQLVVEPETESVTVYSSVFEDGWATFEIPEVRNPSRRRGLRANIQPVDDAMFDKSLKPPQRRKE